MRIKGLALPEGYTHGWGLHPINMSRLGRIVALAGKNGSGKSRILAAVEHANGMRSDAIVSRAVDVPRKAELENAIVNSPNSPHRPQWETLLSQIDERQKWASVLQVDQDAAVRAIRFVPKRLDFANPIALPPNDLYGRFERTKTVDVSADLANTCLSYIQQTQNRFWNATHPGYIGEEDQRLVAISEYETLQKLVSGLLGVEIERSIDGYCRVFGKDMFEARLSDGQKVLLQLAVALHAQKTNLSRCFLILDEPENHLHPSVAIDVLERLFETAPDSQIWVATHSVPLLAYVLSKDSMALWYVNDGSVSHAGRNPGLVLQSLLGGEERIGQLHAFTGLPAQLAAVNYAVDSLMSPVVVPYDGADPQVNQIHKMLMRMSNGRTLRLLDFGAGKGRLLEGLAALQADNLIADLDYFAIDASRSDAEFCKAAIEQFYEKDRVRHFLNIDDMLNETGDDFFDVVVMCNVLHEISPTDWLALFKKDSGLARSILPEGYLLIVEDTRMPTGEKAHQYGFLVLDTQHLKTLFDVTLADVQEGRFVIGDARGDGRLKAHLVARELLERMNIDTQREAFRALADTSYRKIQQLRSETASYGNGLLHGFWTQQFANASIYLRSIE